MEKKKIVASTIAISTAAAVAVTSVLSNGVQSTYAQESFSGLEEIIEGKEFKILEIVPDKSLAKLGFMVAGQETFFDPATGNSGLLEDVLSGMDSTTERTTYVNTTLTDALSAILSDGNTDSVLSYQTYEESYVSRDTYDKQFQLASKQTLKAASEDLAGYSVTDLGEDADTGHYSLESKYMIAPNSTDPSVQRYRENISYFYLASENRYYDVSFELMSSDEVNSYKNQGIGVYTPISGEPIMESRWKDELPDGTLFYEWNAVDDSFTLCRKITVQPTEEPDEATPGNGTENTGTSESTEQSADGIKLVSEWSDDFYMVYFQYVAAEKITDSGNCYKVSDYTFRSDGKGTYGAFLDDASPYLPDASGTFIKDDASMYYAYSADGGQRYELVKADNDTEHPNYDVEVENVYYTGGISSNDTFKEDVFNQSGLLDNDSTMNITVSTVTPSEVTVKLVDDYDLIYFSNSSSFNLKENPSSYSEETDLSGPVANAIYTLATDKNLSTAVYKPVILDSSILDSNENSNTNIYKLAKLLSGADLASDRASYDEETDTWNVSFDGYESFADTDSNGYFVNCNIFSVPADETQIDKDKFSLIQNFAVPFVRVEEDQRTEYENYSSDSESTFNTYASSLGFGEVSASICLENFIRESENTSKTDTSVSENSAQVIEGTSQESTAQTSTTGTTEKYKFFDLSISKAICVEYIICYTSKRETSTEDMIYVLDIEPCTISSVDKTNAAGEVTSASTQTKIENQIKDLLGILNDGIEDEKQISFTHMTSAELIGKVEDLCNYDLIYMGLYTDSMNVETVTRYYLKSDTTHSKPVDTSTISNFNDYVAVKETITNYNDSNMKGLIYSNIGDQKKSSTFAGVFDTDYKVITSNDYWNLNGTIRSSGLVNAGMYGKYIEISDGKWYSGSGISDNYSAARYSGNDLTMERLDDLIDYVKSSAPVILADDFLTTQSDGKRVVNDFKTIYKEVKAADGTITLEPDDGKTENGAIDNCSRMYELVDSVAGSTTYKNVKTVSEWTNNKELLNRYITLGKPQLDVTEQAPVTGEKYVQIDGDTIVIDFTVKSYASTDTKTSFNVDLYVDFNADGRYSKTSEKIDVNAYNIYRIDEDGSRTLQKVVTVKEKGNTTEYHRVAPLNGQSDEVHYRLEYTVQKDYQGIYPVKLVVEQQDNQYRYRYWQGYFYHSKTSGSDTQDVYVLQILPSSVTVSDYYNCALFDMDLTGSYSGGATTDDAEYSEYYKDKYKDHTASNYYTFTDVDASLDSRYTQAYWNGADLPSDDARNARRWEMLINTFQNSTFYKYIYGTVEEGCKLSGYTMHIDSIFGDTLVEKFTKADGSFDQTGYQNYLDHFDMLVLGFGDSVKYFSSSYQSDLIDKYYAGIHNYIASGKSVLFTHDTTSIDTVQSVSENKTVKDSSGMFSSLLAGDVGFDRYGVYDNDDSLLSLALSAGIDLEKNDTTPIKVEEYPSLECAMAKIAEDTTLQETYGLKGTESTITKGNLYDIIVGEATKEHKDIAYEPNSEQNTLTKEVQGRSTIGLNMYGNATGYSLINLVHDKDVFNDNRSITNSWGTKRVTTAELINTGQILIYPYNILDQLDDGVLQIAKTHYQYYQIDMNADEDNDGESDITVWLSLTDGETGSIEYDAAKRDARNNYYIYTKGNITYSGVGHNRVNSKNNVAEVQLYINTLIASYQASASKPDVSFKESAEAGAAEQDTIYLSVDATINENGQVLDADAVSLDNDTEPSSYQTTDGADGKPYYWKADPIESDGKVDSSSYESTYVFVQDTNVTRGTEKEIKLSYYLVYDSESDIPEAVSRLKLNLKTLLGEAADTWAIPLDLETYTMLYNDKGVLTPEEFNEQENAAVSGKTYRIDIPYYLLANSKKRAEIRCYATTTIKKDGTVISTNSDYDSIYLQRISLFDLQ